jgi:hypothetical protein
MRPSLALLAIAAFVLGGASLVRADAPPAAPIFYCPTPGKGDPAPSVPARPATHAGHAKAPRHPGCPVVQVAARRIHGHRHAASTTIVVARVSMPQPRANNDVSASQAFIYRYERALHGLDARAADQAWAEGRHPPCPHGPADRCPGHWRQADIHVYAQSAPIPPVEQRPLPPPRVERAPPPPPIPVPVTPPPVRAYAWQDGGDRFDEREQQSQRAGGWRYSEVDGQGHYQHWGDHFAGEPAWNNRTWDNRAENGGGSDDRRWDDRDGRRRDDGDERYGPAPRYRCPPPVPASACGAGPEAPVRHSVVAAAGRDAAGYLTWPGKTE